MVIFTLIFQQLLANNLNFNCKKREKAPILMFWKK